MIQQHAHHFTGYIAACLLLRMFIYGRALLLDKAARFCATCCKIVGMQFGYLNAAGPFGKPFTM
jgi:hypothetical protein